jgi:N-acetylmuramoyl-L-alanine amidase
VKTVLIQAGHNHPLEPGFESGTGTYREAEFTAAVQRELLALFSRDRRFKAVGSPGRIDRSVRCDLFLSIHGDGSANQASSGYCFGYPVHRVNQRLASCIAKRYDRIPGHPPHRTDNYTRDLSGYYGFRRVETLGPEVLHECGFLTNPGERTWMFSNVAKIAAAQYAGICDYFGLAPVGEEAPGYNAVRLRATRAWILAQRAAGKSWAWIKSTPNWREFRRRGGR